MLEDERVLAFREHLSSFSPLVVGECGVWTAEVQGKGLTQLLFAYLMERKKSIIFSFSIP